MSARTPAISFDQFTTFGDLLKFLRRRAGLTQRELSIAVGYSDAQISRLEQNQRLPDLATITARFVPALDAEDEPAAVKRLMELAAAVRREDAPLPGLPPFKGLHYFDEADAELFFGREALTANLVARLTPQPPLLTRTSASGEGAPKAGVRFLAIIGASGSGKSSLVRAGVASALRWNPHSASWPVHTLTPTAHPLESLVQALDRDSSFASNALRDPRCLHLALKQETQRVGALHVMLVVDQFEELFALCREELERKAFIDNLLTAAFVPEGPAVVTLTLRADFYAHCAPYDNLREALTQHQEYIGPMTSDELRRAIEEPAKQGGWELEPGLVDLLLNDVGEEPGALPLLSHALLETWQRRQGRRLTLSGYTSSGGVRGAIAETAETVFKDQLSAEQREIARRIFLRLTELGEDATVSDTRRRAGYDELIHKPEDAVAVREVLKALADARLIITEKNSAEVAHEALIREWPTLRGWLEENREGLRLQRRLTEAAQTWNEFGRQPGELYRDARLAQAMEWAATHEAEMNALEREFLDASKAHAEHEAAEREAQRQRELGAARRLAETERARAESERQRAEEQMEHVTRVRARNRVIAGAGAIALVLAVLAGVFGLQSNRNATDARQNAATATVALGESQMRGTQAAQQAQLALDAQATAQVEADIRATAQADAEQARGEAEQGAALSFSRELAVQAKLNLTVDPERSILLALAALDQAYSQEAENVLHEAVSASRVRLTLRGHEGQIWDLAYSPDGKTIATAGDDKTVRIWDAATGKELLRLQHANPVGAVGFSPDGARLATAAGDGQVRLWDVASGKELATIAAVTNVIEPIPYTLIMTFSPDGKLLATLENHATEVRFWDPASGAELFRFSDPGWPAIVPNFEIRDIRFSPDGTRLAVPLDSRGKGLGQIELWDLRARQKVLTLAGRWDPQNDTLGFSPDGTRLATRLSPDGRAAVWDLVSGRLLFNLKEGVNDIAYSADGKRLLTAAGGGRAKVFDAETGEELLVLVGHIGRVLRMAESPGCAQPPAAPFAWCGSHLATAGDDGTVRIWDVSPAGSQELMTLPGNDFALSEAGTRLSTFVLPPYDPEGSTVSIHEWDMPVWSAASPSVQAFGYLSSTVRLEPGYQTTTFYPTEGIMAAGSGNGPFKFWDVTERGKGFRPVSCCPLTEDTIISFSSKREPLAAFAHYKTGTLMIWDLVADAQINTLQVAGPNDLWWLSLSPDGERVAIINVDKTVATWDMVTGRKLLTLPRASSLSDRNLWFSPDGKWLAVSDCTGTVAVWDAATGKKKLTLSADVVCIGGVGFSPDGKLIAVNSGQRGLKILDFETGRELVTLPGGLNVQFTPDGMRVIEAVDDPAALVRNTVHIYLVRLEDLMALAKTRVTRALTTMECQQYLHVEQCPED